MAFTIKEVYLNNPGHKIGGVDSVNSFISQVLPNAYVIAGVLLLIYAVVGGFLIISSAGKPEGTDKGKQILTNAIIGFIIIFASYWIIQIIQIITGVEIV